MTWTRLFLEVDPIRKNARLALIGAEHDREAALRALEHARLAALQERFPTADETARYILAQLLAEGACLACGNDVPEVAESLESRVRLSRCVVCDTLLDQDQTRNAETLSLSDKRISRAAEVLNHSKAKLTPARSRLDDSEKEYADYRQRFEAVNAAFAERRTRMDTLIRQLPDEAKALRHRRQELAMLRGRVEAMKANLSKRRVAFSSFIEEVKKLIVDHAPLIKETFEGYAREFLLEDCDLRWGVLPQRVGQTGPRVDFPVFELDLASASYRSPVRRSGPGRSLGKPTGVYRPRIPNGADGSGGSWFGGDSHYRRSRVIPRRRVCAQGG